MPRLTLHCEPGMCLVCVFMAQKQWRWCVQKLKNDMHATEARLREAAGERARLLAEADEVKRQYLVAQDNVEEEQSVVMRMRVRPPAASLFAVHVMRCL